MIKWLHVTLISVSAVIFAAILLLITIKRCFAHEIRKQFTTSERETAHSNNNISLIKEQRHVRGVFQRGFSKKTVFNWSDHPSLVSEAVENGWSRFAFMTFASSPSVNNNKSRVGVLLSSVPCLTSTGTHESPGRNEAKVEITWEVCEGSSDYMQKIRFLNPSLKKRSNNGLSVIRTGLPLPGPYLGINSFPQVAYFEITMLYVNENSDRLNEKEKKGKTDQGEKVKLIEEDFNKKIHSPDSSLSTRVDSSHSQRKINNIKIDDLLEDRVKNVNDAVLISLGLASGNSLPLKFPGSYLGSIGFNSTGSVYLDGTKLISESDKTGWSTLDKVIGCGYEPTQMKVFFTIDSQLVHEIHCKTEEFTSPLYPILASNADDTLVLVNLGQSPFKYLPANSHRTPNPCFVGSNCAKNSPALCFEDSKELFSMGRIDSQWLQRKFVISNNDTVNSVKSLEYYDVESESDLFEIVLDHNSVRSQYTTPTTLNQ